MRVDRKKVLERAIQAAGGLAAIAEPLGVTPQAVSQWNEVPSRRVLDVERLSGIPRTELRPDLYPPEPAESATT
jgi:DNA-binding transcriptional regulator YdaS (Cro superfamily)